MTMKELCSMFRILLRYVAHIIGEKTKIQRFLSFFPPMFKEIIEYGNPKNLEKAMRKANLCYGQNKNKRDNIPNWKNKRCECFEQKKERHTLKKNWKYLLGLSRK